MFEINERVKSVFRGKAFYGIFFVFLYASKEIVCYSYIKGAEGFICKYV